MLMLRVRFVFYMFRRLTELASTSSFSYAYTYSPSSGEASLTILSCCANIFAFKDHKKNWFQKKMNNNNLSLAELNQLSGIASSLSPGKNSQKNFFERNIPITEIHLGTQELWPAWIKRHQVVPQAHHALSAKIQRKPENNSILLKSSI